MSDLTDRVRAKYPGVYDDLSDADLEKSILAKHPEYADLATKPPPPPAAQPQSFGDQLTASLKRLNAAGYEDPQKLTQGLLLGGVGPTAGELINAIPNAARAAGKFQQVMSAAKNAAVDVNAPGDAALRIQQLAERGGTMPRMVRQFIGRITDPSQGDLLYPEARDFASNISRLSADEYNRLTPVIQREVGNLKTALNGAIGQAADSVGQGDAYRSAMQEYASAAKLSSYKDALLQAFKQGALPTAGAAGAGYWLGSKLRGLFGEQ